MSNRNQRIKKNTPKMSAMKLVKVKGISEQHGPLFTYQGPEGLRGAPEIFEAGRCSVNYLPKIGPSRIEKGYISALVGNTMAQCF